jgi:hypothetical protein
MRAVTSEDILKRVGATTEAALQWLAEAPMGNVCFRPKGDQGYSRTIFHSFGNVANTKVFLTPGQTHVSVGFLDLGGLAASCVAMEDLLADGGMGVLRWVGYEASAYCVAKTEVVAEMMRTRASTDDILQVCTLSDVCQHHPIYCRSWCSQRLRSGAPQHIYPCNYMFYAASDTRKAPSLEKPIPSCLS